MDANRQMNWFWVIVIAAAIALMFVLVNGNAFSPSEAGAQEKASVCHCEGSKCSTLSVGKPAVEAHLREHDDDYKGVCRGDNTPTVTPNVSVSPTATPSATPTPTTSVTPTGSQRDDVVVPAEAPATGRAQ